MKTMPVTPEWLRSSAVGRPIGVDKEEKILRGYVVAQEGPFKTPGRGEFDKAALREIVRMGNAARGGLKSRFTHPDMSNDGLGKFLGRSQRFSLASATVQRQGELVEVDAVRADLHFDATALTTPPEGGRPLGWYVMHLAESDPDALSSSLVLHADEEVRLNKDGTRMKDSEGNDLPPLWRPIRLHASDIVDTGDAVDGLLSAQLDVEGFPLAALWKGAQMLDSVFAGQPREVVETRCREWLERYLARRFGAPVREPAGPAPTPRLDTFRLRLDQMALTTRKLGA